MDEETLKKFEAKRIKEQEEFAEYQQWLNTHVQAQCKATKGVKRVVRVKTVEGDVTVSAIVYGKSIAVHESLNSFFFYTLTQVSSGKIIAEFSKLEMAKKVACVLYREVQWANDILEMSREEIKRAVEIISAFNNKRKPDFIDLNSPPKLG